MAFQSTLITRDQRDSWGQHGMGTAPGKVDVTQVRAQGNIPQSQNNEGGHEKQSQNHQEEDSTKSRALLSEKKNKQQQQQKLC